MDVPLFSELGFVKGRATVSLNIALKALNKVGYLFKGFFHGGI
jgi:hypothetical protein